MIRINLLPVPKSRKSQPLIFQGIFGVIVLLAVAGACYFLVMQKAAELAQKQAEIAQKQREIEELKARVGEVEKYKRQAQLLEEQLGVIRALEKGRAGPVKMMDELTEIVPKRLWISSFKEAGKKVTIEGTAESGPVIADLLDSLKTAKHFSNAQLSIVSGVEQDGMKLHRFTITATVKYDV